MNDLISRAAAIDAICDNCDAVKASCPHYPCGRYVAVEKLSPAQPERKKGKWTVKEGELLSLDECSVCRKIVIHRTPHYNFCPHCGADMREDTDDQSK